MQQKLTYFKTLTDTEWSLTSSQTLQRRDRNSKLLIMTPIIQVKTWHWNKLTQDGTPRQLTIHQAQHFVHTL